MVVKLECNEDKNEVDVCTCIFHRVTRERDRYEAGLMEIADEVGKRPGTPGFPTILAIIKRAMTPE